jgi:hypothetical protein
MQVFERSTQNKAVKTGILLVALLLLISSQSFDQSSQEASFEKSDYVILLHGLARTYRSMNKIEKRLSKIGYRVINVDYPSTEHPIEYLAENVLGEIIERYPTDSETKIHFVTHSMGGIIVRYYLNHHRLESLGRVVMLSPPNQGSELVDHLRNTYLYKEKNGPAGQQLGTDEKSVPRSLGPVDFELGVITGSLSFNPASSMVIPGQDDGIVSVESAKVKGMTDFIVMPNSHTFIMKSKSVIKQIIHFLQNGEFNHPKSRKKRRGRLIFSITVCAPMERA